MYKKDNSQWLKHLDFEIIDIICLVFSFYLAFRIRHPEVNEELITIYTKLSFVLVIIDIAVLFFTNNYKGIIQRDKYQELMAVLKHVSIVQITLLVYEFVVKETDDFSRKIFVTSWLITIVISWLVRCAWKKVIRRKVMKEDSQSKMLLISTSEHAKVAVEKLNRKDYREYKINAICVLDEKTPQSIDDDTTIISGQDKLMEYIRQEVVDEVYIDVFENPEKLEELVRVFLSMGITVHIGMAFLPDTLPNTMMEEMGEATVITTSVSMASKWKLTIKRIIDIIGAIVGLIITGIAFIFVAPAIKKASPGPIFFKQKRVGKNGRIFYIYKFRSMYMDAEERKKELMAKNEMQGLMFKMENDPRIIGSEKGPGKGLGNFIRKTSIDELPQFWNILIGDMSLVGTRPPTVNEYEQYDLHHKIRLSMKPGLTGMWQASGRSDITDFEEVVRLDTKYIETWSLALDIKLILKTIDVVLKGEGSK